MKEQEKMTKVERKALKVRQAQAEYREAVREQKKQERKAQDRHKYMTGGCVLKYFPEGLDAYDFNEQEMNRMNASEREKREDPDTHQKQRSDTVNMSILRSKRHGYHSGNRAFSFRRGGLWRIPNRNTMPEDPLRPLSARHSTKLL